MSAKTVRRAPVISLRELVDRYQALAGSFGTSVALSSFNFSHAETEHLFSSYDEDYHISRFFHFTESEGQTHVALDSQIETIL